MNMITSIDIAQLLLKEQKLAFAQKTGFDSALLNLGVTSTVKKTKRNRK